MKNLKSKSTKSVSKSFTLMAVATGKKSTDGADIKRYIGIGACKCIAFNPSKAQIKELMGYEPKEEQVYFGVQHDDETNKDTAFARLSFVMQTIPEKCNGIKLTQMLTIFIRNQYNKGSKSGKYQVLDEFGRTAWAEKEVIDAKAQIMYSNGPANVTTNYRPAYIGEEDLTDFIQKLINIPSPTKYVNGSYVMKDATELQDSICRLDEIPSYFKGNFKEITDILALQPDNYVKVLFGVRTTDDGKEYQDIYTKVLRSATSNYEKLQAEIEDRQANGGLSNRTYEFCELKEYNVAATNYSAPTGGEDPLAGGSSENTPWG